MPDPTYQRPSASVKLHATSVQPTYWPEEAGLARMRDCFGLASFLPPVGDPYQAISVKDP